MWCSSLTLELTCAAAAMPQTAQRLGNGYSYLSYSDSFFMILYMKLTALFLTHPLWFNTDIFRFKANEIHRVAILAMTFESSTGIILP